MMSRDLDPSKHPFSAALYNKSGGKNMPHEWGGEPRDEYVGKHRKNSKGCVLVLVAMATPVIYGIVEWLT